jgi:hypothetical protein
MRIEDIRMAGEFKPPKLLFYVPDESIRYGKVLY